MEADTLYDLFLSYSEKDRLIAEALVERLKTERVRYWWAPETLQGGTNYQEVIARDIPRCRLLLLLLSDKAGYSNHVKREVMIAMEEGKPILPVRIENVQPPVHLRYALTGEHRLDAFPKFREHLDKISGALLSLLESLRRETPVVRLLEPADGGASAKGAPLRVVFEVVPGADRRVKRVRLELRRDGTLLHHRALAESEINDRGGRHSVEWLLPEMLADGGRFQLAVLASDNNGQEGSAQMEGSFALGATAVPALEALPQPAGVVAPAATPPKTEDSPVEGRDAVANETEPPLTVREEPRPVAAPAPAAAVSLPKPAPSRGARVAGGTFAALFGMGAWSFRLVWVLALTGAVAGLGHHLLEPLAAVRKHTVYFPPPRVEIPDTIRPGGLFDRSRFGPGSAAEQMLKAPLPGAATNPPPVPDNPAPPVNPISEKPLSERMLEGAGLSKQPQPRPGLPATGPFYDMRLMEGPRLPGRPLMALFNIVRRSDDYSIGWHQPIPREEADQVSAWTAIGQGAGLGAMLGLVAGIVAGLLAAGIAAVRRLPMEMLPLAEEKTFWSDFGIVVIVTGLTIIDTGARQPDTGRWTTPLFWWVAGLTIFCLLASQTVQNAVNQRRQRALLG